MDQLLWKDDKGEEEWWRIEDIEKHRGLSGIKRVDGTFEDSLDWVIERRDKLQAQYPDIEFWIKKIIHRTPDEWIQFTVRPYIQGYGCDGTTDGNIHLIAMIWCDRHDIDYSGVYAMAYEKEPTWMDFIRNMYPPETIIPDKIDTTKMLDDLYDINNRSLEEILSDTVQKVAAFEARKEKLF